MRSNAGLGTDARVRPHPQEDASSCRDLLDFIVSQRPLAPQAAASDAHACGPRCWAEGGSPFTGALSGRHPHPDHLRAPAAANARLHAPVTPLPNKRSLPLCLLVFPSPPRALESRALALYTLTSSHAPTQAHRFVVRVRRLVRSCRVVTRCGVHRGMVRDCPDLAWPSVAQQPTAGVPRDQQ